jgi:hypothetical protein
MTKIIFADFDGVLNSHRFMAEWKLRGEKGVVGLDPKAVARLDRLCKEGEAMVVVSSTWRYNHGVGELKDLLREAGFTGIVRDRTPLREEIVNEKLTHMFTKSGVTTSFDEVKKKIVVVGERGGEIDAWLKNWPGDNIESFVILDDDADIAPHLDRHVQTDFADGLQDRHVEQALAILRKPYVRVTT